MQQLKKILRLAALIILIILASVGVCMFGGIPVPAHRRRENTIEIRTEIKETGDIKNDTVFFNDQL